MAEMTKLIRTQRVSQPTLLLIALAACSHDTENATRMAVLEDEVRRLSVSVNAMSAGSVQRPPTAAGPSKPFSIECPQPWLLHPPLGATLWTCRSPTPTPEGYYPQCSIVVQAQVAIETHGYFELAWNASPQLQQVKNIKDKPIKIKDHEGFEAVYEAEPKPVPVKMRSVLIPHREQVYAVTCFATRDAFDDYDAKAFQKIISTIAFPQGSGAAQ